MKFDNIFSIADIISIITLATVIIGGIFALYQYKKNSNLKKSDYFSSLMDFLNDKEFLDLFKLIDYGEFKYDGEFHDSPNNIENGVDKFLFRISFIYYLKRKNLISNNEFINYEYFVNRVCSNMEIINYFFNLYHFNKKIGCPFPYINLLKYCKKHKFIDSTFYNPNSPNFIKFLNF